MHKPAINVNIRFCILANINSFVKLIKNELSRKHSCSSHVEQFKWLKMEEIKTNLELLLSSLPVSCTLINIQKLKQAFQEYKSLIALLPGKFVAIKKYCEKIFDFIKAKIELIEKNARTRISKNIFQEAVNQLKSQIEMVLLTIGAESA